MKNRKTRNPKLETRNASFEFALPTRVLFGAGVLERLGEVVRELGLKHVLVVSDPGVVAAGHAPRGVEAIRRAGVSATLFDGARENPTTQHVDAALAVAQELSVDGFVGLGGGSSMDTAKGANLLLTHGGRIADYWGEGKLRRQTLPLVAVPTTAGTGSEVQSAALIADAQTHRKMVCRDRLQAPRVALLDPDLIATQPPAVAAATGIDAMAHALESYVTTRRTPLSQLFALEAWRQIAPGIERALADPADAPARAAMLLGALLAGAAIENSMLGAAHAASNPITADYGVTHGIAVGIMLPHVIRFNAQAAGDLYVPLAAAAGQPASEGNGSAAAEALALRVGEIVAGSGLPTTLAAVDIPRQALPDLARRAAEEWTARCNPRPIASDDMARLYEAAYG